MEIAQGAMFLLVAFVGTAVALTREPTNQAIVSGLYGVLLAVLFYVLHAPDVSLAAITVGSVGLPLMILMALARVRGTKK